MNDIFLPPLPAGHETDSRACEIVHLYLAVWDDLTPEQRRSVAQHVRGCESCTQEMRQVQQATRLVADLPPSQPSKRVDAAVRAAIAARAQERGKTSDESRPVAFPERRRAHARARWRPAMLVAAALMALGVLLVSYLFFLRSAQEFQIPSQVSWNGYVLYHIQTQQTSDGASYQVKTYHDFTSNMFHVETVMDDKLDVVAVGNAQHGVLGKDMMNHVAQWDAANWVDSDAMFDLQKLRADIAAGRASYIGKGTFQGREVYQIRYQNGDILLLDMHYMPVNVLEQKSSSSEKPMYDTLEVLTQQQVPESLWDMQVPSGFKMGELPQKP